MKFKKFKYGDFVEITRKLHDNSSALGFSGIVIGECREKEKIVLLYIPYFAGHDYISSSSEPYAYEAYKSLGGGKHLWFTNEDYLTKIGEKPEDMSYEQLGKIIKSFDDITNVTKEACESFKDLLDDLFLDDLFNEELDDSEEENKNIHNHPIIKEFDEIFRKELLGGKEWWNTLKKKSWKH